MRDHPVPACRLPLTCLQAGETFIMGLSPARKLIPPEPLAILPYQSNSVAEVPSSLRVLCLYVPRWDPPLENGNANIRPPTGSFSFSLRANEPFRQFPLPIRIRHFVCSTWDPHPKTITQTLPTGSFLATRKSSLQRGMIIS